MKRLTAILAALALTLAAAAQTTSEEYLAKYNRLVARLGYSGVGIETHLDKWEADWPEDGRMLEARCNYCLSKGSARKVVAKDQAKFLGAKPLLSLPDSTGHEVNYFEEVFYDDILFGQAVSYIDRAIELYPDDLLYRYDKIICLLAYEKESPDMALQELLGLVEMEKKHTSWKVGGEPAEEGDFEGLVSSYCVKLYETGSPDGYEAFYKLSTQLNKLYPKASNYLDNIGSYWLVGRGNDRKAAGFYKKALKLNPDDAVAKQNLRLIERRKEQQKKKKS